MGIQNLENRKKFGKLKLNNWEMKVIMKKDNWSLEKLRNWKFGKLEFKIERLRIESLKYTI